MNYEALRRLKCFENDLKKLLRKYRTLEGDISTFLSALKSLPENYRGIPRIPGLGYDSPEVYKAKKFACRSIKGRGSNSGIRIIFAYFRDENRIELVSIYHKNQQENHDEKLLKDLYGK